MDGSSAQPGFRSAPDMATQVSFKSPYSGLDRLLHRLAFCHGGVQKMLAAIEDDLFVEKLADMEVPDPVFITSLPRAGTTLLLEVLAKLPDFATHTYRNMPFVLAPLLWDRISSGFRRTGGNRLRAHDDGMTVGYDTPEAFEEVAWMPFWPEQYRADRILPWPDGAESPEFKTALTAHMRKLVALRRNGASELQIRYLSKNNANVARLPLLCRLFPKTQIVVPFRHPFHHARSMLRQHLNFLKIHQEDGFSRRYMASIGHFEFGQVMKPINMDDWLSKSADLQPTDIDFWLAYWIATFEALLKQKSDQVMFVSYECICTEPEHGLETLARLLRIKESAPLLSQIERFHPPVQYDPNSVICDTTLRDEALTVHQALMDVAVN